MENQTFVSGNHEKYRAGFFLRRVGCRLAGAVIGAARRRSRLLQLYRLEGHPSLTPNRFVDFAAAGRFCGRSLPCLLAGMVGAVLTTAGKYTTAAIVLTSAVALPFIWRRLADPTARCGAEILADYPSTLMAMASSMKAGLTPLPALERAARLLGTGNALRIEIQSMIGGLRRGIPREEAVAGFASRHHLPEIELFRAAFLLVLENGGRFTPTLERLSLVGRERSALIQSARVSTQSMRMTANIMLGLTPALILVVSSGTSEYWRTLTDNPAAGLMGGIGAALIAAGYLSLRVMSNFKP